MSCVVSAASCPIAVHPQEEFGSIFSATSHQVVADCNKVPLQPSLLQAQQSQLAQPLLTHYVLQSLGILGLDPGYLCWIHSSMFMSVLC